MQAFIFNKCLSFYFLLNIYHLFIRLVFIALLYTSSKKMVQYNIMIIKLSHINEVYINEQIP